MDMNFYEIANSRVTVPRLLFCKDKASDYVNRMRWRNEIACEDDGIDELNDNMIDLIVVTARELSMVQVVREN